MTLEARPSAGFSVNHQCQQSHGSWLSAALGRPRMADRFAMSCPSDPDLGDVFRQIYAATRERFKILHAPPRAHPPVLFIGIQPGGDKAEAGRSLPTARLLHLIASRTSSVRPFRFCHIHKNRPTVADPR
jgi:hypothetical protein